MKAKWGSVLALPFQSKCKGQDLFDQIMYHIDLVETDYFGLQFMDTEQVSVSNPPHASTAIPQTAS